MSDAREASLTPSQAAAELRAYRRRVANGAVDSTDMLDSVGKCYPVLAQYAIELLDDEPITREWVYDNMTITGYGAKINDCLYLKQSKAGWGVYAFNANSEYPEEEFLVATVSTVGDVRRWLALGIGK